MTCPEENGAQERTRTSTPLRAPAPEAGASTNSATWARGRGRELGAGPGLVNRAGRAGGGPVSFLYLPIAEAPDQPGASRAGAPDEPKPPLPHAARSPTTGAAEAPAGPRRFG